VLEIKKFEILSVNEERPLYFILLLQIKGKLNNLIDYGTGPEAIV
jgi:hypothetical protein